jgi:hypothetical protein
LRSVGLAATTRALVPVEMGAAGAAMRELPIGAEDNPLWVDKATCLVVSAMGWRVVPRVFGVAASDVVAVSAQAKGANGEDRCECTPVKRILAQG